MVHRDQREEEKRCARIMGDGKAKRQLKPYVRYAEQHLDEEQ